MNIQITTWNVNSVRARSGQISQWLTHHRPDILCLQELKCQDEQFPFELFDEAGYNVILRGQKSYNGVAIASRYPVECISNALYPEIDDEQARFLDVLVSIDQKTVRVVNIYAPNGNPYPGEKFLYKCQWYKKLLLHAQSVIGEEGLSVLLGDFNIIPYELDVHNPDDWREDALFVPEARSFYHELLGQGWTDLLGIMHPEGGKYTFWDYQAGAYQKNNGIRIDHIMVSPAMADCTSNATVDRDARGMEKPSDHAPVSAWFSLPNLS